MRPPSILLERGTRLVPSPPDRLEPRPMTK